MKGLYLWTELQNARREGESLILSKTSIFNIFSGLHVVVGILQVVVVIDGVVWLLGSVNWSQQMGRGKKR